MTEERRECDLQEQWVSRRDGGGDPNGGDPKAGLAVPGGARKKTAPQDGGDDIPVSGDPKTGRKAVLTRDVGEGDQLGGGTKVGLGVAGGGKRPKTDQPGE
jgi:hypothetical protein